LLSIGESLDGVEKGAHGGVWNSITPLFMSVMMFGTGATLAVELLQILGAHATC
jgi:hypothetical protein